MSKQAGRLALGLLILLAGCASPAASVIPSQAASQESSPSPEASTALPVLDAFPEGFATEYVALGHPPHQDGELSVETVDFWKVGGSFPIGSGELSFSEALETGASVTCGGVVHEDPHLSISDISDPKGQLVGTIGDASILLQPDHQVGVFPQTGNTEPTCWEQTGTYTATFTTGPTLGVKTGSYLLTLSNLTLE